MSRPRILLVPEFTEIEWVIRPRLEEWAEVASYDPPGVGDEPAPEGLSRDAVVRRGLEEVDRRAWTRFFIAADGWAIASAAHLAAAQPAAILGMALGHAKLSYRRDGERAPINADVWDAFTQLLDQDLPAFVRYAIAQVTGGSIGEELAEQMLARIPEERMAAGWEGLTRDEPFGELLTALDCPLLLAKHEGCLMSTEEGFDDAAAALSPARAAVVEDAPLTSDAFADAIRSFCMDVIERAADTSSPAPSDRK